MKFNIIEVAGIASALALLALASVFFVTQGVVHAEAGPCDLPGMTVFGCEPEGDMATNDPCSLPGMESNPECGGGVSEGDGESLAEEINCEIYAQLIAQGSPIPPNFDGSQCGADGGGSGDGDGDGGGGEDGEGGGGGGGGGTLPACSDTLDNDNDGLIDMADDDCADSQDNDESDPAPSSGSGGGGGGGGGGSAVSAATSTGDVLSAATSTPSIACDKYLTAFIRFGAHNDEEQVKRLQYVLKNFEAARVEENGTYDEATLSAVHAFQTKYAEEILAPWGIAQSTGYVYLTTRKKVNEVYCNYGLKFPLTEEELQVIEKTKNPPRVPAQTVAPAAPKAPTPAVEVEEAGADVGAAASGEPPVIDSWARLGNFFWRLFERIR